MTSVHFTENGLNVEYISDFLQKDVADRYFEDLKTLPFYTPTLRIRGRDIKPKRQALAFSDPGLSYSFSGTTIHGNPWTPLILELRDLVEKQCGCTYNYVLLNLYRDGGSYISHHKDDECELDSTFPISVLSFGAKRKIEFKNALAPMTCINLNHGSFYSMNAPTNQLFTHGIPPDPTITQMRISLTFRHIIPKSTHLKKQKMNLDHFSVSPDQSNTNVESNLVIPENDWFNSHFQNFSSCDPLLIEFDLNCLTFFQVRLENQIYLRLHIRNFKESNMLQKYPSKEGVVLNLPTWQKFSEKIQHFNFYSIDESFVGNNQILVCFIDSDYCYLQQLFNLEKSGFYLKNSGIKMSKDQILKLIELVPQINESLVEIILTRVIPSVIMNRIPVCSSHLNQDSAKDNFLTCFEKAVESSVNKIFKCEGCRYEKSSVFRHECINTPMKEKFELLKQSALLNLNTFQLAKNVTLLCSCYYTKDFFEKLNIDFYNDLFEKLFQ